MLDTISIMGFCVLPKSQGRKVAVVLYDVSNSTACQGIMRYMSNTNKERVINKFVSNITATIYENDVLF